MASSPEAGPAPPPAFALLDERIRQAVEAISPLASIEKELRALAQRISELEKKLDG